MSEQKVKCEKMKAANQFIAVGAGVGALGLSMETLVEAACPVCYLIAPSLVGIGVIKRLRARIAKRQLTASNYLKIREKSYRPRPDQTN